MEKIHLFLIYVVYFLGLNHLEEREEQVSLGALVSVLFAGCSLMKMKMAELIVLIAR